MSSDWSDEDDDTTDDDWFARTRLRASTYGGATAPAFGGRGLRTVSGEEFSPRGMNRIRKRPVAKSKSGTAKTDWNASRDRGETVGVASRDDQTIGTDSKSNLYSSSTTGGSRAGTGSPAPWSTPTARREAPPGLMVLEPGNGEKDNQKRAAQPSTSRTPPMLPSVSLHVHDLIDHVESAAAAATVSALSAAARRSSTRSPNISVAHSVSPTPSSSVSFRSTSYSSVDDGNSGGGGYDMEGEELSIGVALKLSLEDDAFIDSLTSSPTIASRRSLLRTARLVGTSTVAADPSPLPPAPGRQLLCSAIGALHRRTVALSPRVEQTSPRSLRVDEAKLQLLRSAKLVGDALLRVGSRAAQSPKSVPPPGPSAGEQEASAVLAALSQLSTGEQRVASYEQAVGIRFADLELGPVIGRGFFGEVLAARWLGVDVACKAIYRKSFRQLNAAEMFAREVRVHATLRHPHVVQLLGIAIDDASLSHIMVHELMRGGSLHARIHSYGAYENVPWIRHDELIGSIAVQICKGLLYLHSLDLVHRDLSPHNVLLASKGRNPLAKICDFGLTTTASHARTSASAGAILYMAPEAFNKLGSTKRSDVFSFGVVLWEMISGLEPHIADSPPMTARDYALAVATRNHRPTLFDIPVEWARVIEQLWAPMPGARPDFRSACGRVARAVGARATRLLRARQDRMLAAALGKTSREADGAVAKQANATTRPRSKSLTEQDDVELPQAVPMQWVIAPAGTGSGAAGKDAPAHRRASYVSYGGNSDDPAPSAPVRSLSLSGRRAFVPVEPYPAYSALSDHADASPSPTKDGQSGGDWQWATDARLYSQRSQSGRSGPAFEYDDKSGYDLSYHMS